MALVTGFRTVQINTSVEAVWYIVTQTAHTFSCASKIAIKLLNVTAMVVKIVPEDDTLKMVCVLFELHDLLNTRVVVFHDPLKIQAVILGRLPKV